MTSYYAEIEMPGLRWSGGAPEPFLIGGEHRTLFAFIPPDEEVTQSEIGEETYRVAEFNRCVCVRFGFRTMRYANHCCHADLPYME